MTATFRRIACAVHYPAGAAGGDVLLSSVPDDPREGLGLLIPERFHAAWSKNQFIARALEQIAPGPAIVHDADVWMPPELLERIEAVIRHGPATGVLYGLAGRRICRTLPRRGIAPRLWLERHQTVIGYCQFTRENDPGPWQTTPQQWGTAHDDWRVYQAFGPERSVALPFACCHLGGVHRHWGGYQGVNVSPGTPEEALPTGAPFRPLLEGKTVLLAGIDGGADAIDLAIHAGAAGVIAMDAWELNQSEVRRVEDLPHYLRGIAGWLPGTWLECRRRLLRGEPALPLEQCVTPLFLDLIKADRAYTRARFERAVASIPEAGTGQLSAGIVRIPEGTAPLQEIADGTLDALWLAGESGCETLLRHLPDWQRKLSREGLLCGSFHDIVSWPEGTACVERLLGTPEIVTADGQWLKRKSSPVRNGYPRPLPHEEPERTAPACTDRGVVLYQNSREDSPLEDLIRSLHSLRRHWTGEIAVLFSGGESPGLRIACARYDALYREVPGPDPGGDPRIAPEYPIQPGRQVRDWSPFRHTLWVEPGLTGYEKEFRKFAERSARSCGRRMDRLRRNPERDRLQSAARAALEVEILNAWASTVRVRYGATVVTGLLPGDLAGFERNWTATRWRHAAHTVEEESRIHEPVPLLAGLCGVSPEEAALAMRHHPGNAGLLEVQPSPAEPHWTAVLAAASGTAQTEWLIYLDPLMHPSPGAELFLAHRLPEEKDCGVHAPGWAFRSIGPVERAWIADIFQNPEAIPEDLADGQLLRHLKIGPSATLIRRDLMRDAFAEWQTRFSGIPFEIFLTLRIRRDLPEPVLPSGADRSPPPRGMAVCRPLDWGWNT